MEEPYELQKEKDLELRWPTWDEIESWTSSCFDAIVGACFLLGAISVASILFMLSSWALSLGVQAWR